jgi:hypothetical protein
MSNRRDETGVIQLVILGMDFAIDFRFMGCWTLTAKKLCSDRNILLGEKY